MKPLHTTILHTLVNPLTTNLQKYILKSKTLNKYNLNTEYLKIKLFQLNFSLMRLNYMCSEHYFRITDTRINPTYLYWHIVQDFQMDMVKRLQDFDYLSRRNLANHIVYISGEPFTMMSIGQFVKHGGRANLSIGKYPRNFGEVSLLSTEMFNQVRTMEITT
jgi:hypothetical protein